MGLIAIQFTQNRHFQRTLRYVVLIGGITWLFSLLLLSLKLREMNLPHAIVIENEVMVRSEPDWDQRQLPFHYMKAPRFSFRRSVTIG